MKTITLHVIASILIFINAATAVEKPLSAYSAEERYDLIHRGGEPLIKTHGEELLSFLYFRKKPTDSEFLEMTSNPPIVKETKRDLPVFQALRKGGETTLQLLRKSKYFDLPQHSCDLEVIAYLLQDMIGKEEVAKFVEERVDATEAYARYNWLKISDMIKMPELASGHFIVEKTAKGSTTEYSPTREQLRILRNQLKILLATMPEKDGQNFLSIHLQFRKILEAYLQYQVIKGKRPVTIFSLVQEGFLKESEILFLDSDQFWYIPRFSKDVPREDNDQCILKLVTPDEKFILKGLQNGELQVSVIEKK